MAGDIDAEGQMEQDSRFPSGPWTGFFIQTLGHAGRHRMDLALSFRESVIRGEGRDWVGRFTINGRYQLTDGGCWMRKQYIGKHEVFYKGYNEGRGIWGRWTIAPSLHGGFHIWPCAMGDPYAPALSEELEEPVLEEAEVLQPVGAFHDGQLRAFFAPVACARTRRVHSH